MYLTLKEIWLTSSLKIKILAGFGFALFVALTITGAWVARNWLAVEPYDGPAMLDDESQAQRRQLADDFLSARLSSAARAVLEEHFRVIGGSIRLASARSVVLNGRIDLGAGAEREITVVKKEGGNVRVTIIDGDNAIVIGVNPTHGWRAEWREGKMVVLHDLDSASRQAFERYRALVSDLYHASVENWEIRYLGTRPVKKIMAHAFEVLPNPFLRMQFYIDPDEYQLLARTETIIDEQGVTKELIEAQYEGIIQHGGLLFPRKITTQSSVQPTQVLNIDSVRVNDGVLNEAFLMPAPEAHFLIPLSQLTEPDP